MAKAAGAVAEAAGTSAAVAQPAVESQDTEVKPQQPMEKVLRVPPMRNPQSMLGVSQVLLRAIASHNGLTLATLREELGHAGYQMRRKCRRRRRSGEVPKSDFKGTLMRISGTNGSRCFRVWKTPKPKRKPGRPRLEEGGRSSRRTPAGPRGPRRHHRPRRAAKKAREVWRREARAAAMLRKSRSRAKDRMCSRAKDWMRSRAKGEKRAKVTAGGRGQTSKEDRPRTRGKTRPRKEKQQDPEKPVKRTIQRSSSVKTDSRDAPSKTSTKPESPRNAAGSP